MWSRKSKIRQDNISPPSTYRQNQLGVAPEIKDVAWQNTAQMQQRINSHRNTSWCEFCIGIKATIMSDDNWRTGTKADYKTTHNFQRQRYTLSLGLEGVITRNTVLACFGNSAYRTDYINNPQSLQWPAYSPTGVLVKDRMFLHWPA